MSGEIPSGRGYANPGGFVPGRGGRGGYWSFPMS